jgi:nitrate reductase gamma subunit
MELLEFARGPALMFSITVFIAGVLFRIFSLLFMWRTKDTSAAHPGQKPEIMAALSDILRRMWPLATYRQRSLFQWINGYVFHIGLFIVVFFLLPHILFINDLTGLSWGHLPNNLVYAISIVTLISLIAALIMRASNPPQRLISTFDDYFSWLVTFLPVLSGIVATMHLGARYETLLALHILSVCLLLIYIPFGKLMHFFLVFITRGQTGAHIAHRRRTTLLKGE